MNKSLKICLILAICAILSGIIIFGVVMSALGWDFTKLSTVEFETNEYEVSEKFNNITVTVDTADIVFAVSDDEKCRVVCYEETKMLHTVSVESNTLTINVVNEKSWYDYIGLNFSSPKIIVYLPNTEYNSLVVNGDTGNVEIPKDFKFNNMDISIHTGDVNCYASVSESAKIAATTGNIHADGISATSLDLSVSTGDTILSNIKCQNLTSTGSTGDISLKNVIATEKISVKRSTGDVKFDRSDAGEIIIETNTGNVTGTLLSEKVFITKTNTGKINVPKTTSGGKCEITTSTGNIKISIENN